MKYLVASDIHGSYFNTKALLNAFEKEKADLLIVLGDIFNHGPRNAFPEEYAPLKVAEALNGIKNELIVVKGNCDSEVDTLISEFDFCENFFIENSGKKIFLTHGHIYNKDNLPKTKFDCIIYGHFHTGFIIKDDTVFANAGSISLPKDNTPKSYITIENGVLTLKELNGKEIKSIEL